MTDATQTVEFQLAGERQVDPAGWAARVAEVRASLAADGLPASEMAEAMYQFRFLDESGATWMHDGTQWLRWAGQAWAGQVPPAVLQLQSFTLDWLADPTESPPAGLDPVAAAAAVPSAAAQPAVIPAPAQSAMTAAPVPAPVTPVSAELAAAAPAPPPYVATYQVPAMGMAAWSNPDPTLPPQFRLDPWLDVMVVEAVPNGWARIRASNGWSGWVDGRLLIPR